MGLVPRRIRMKVQSSFPAGRRINLFWGPGPNPPLWGKENVYYHTLSATSSVPNMSWLSVVQSLSCVQLFATPWTAAHQASLSFTIPQNFLKLMSIESVMPSNHLILCCPLLASFPSIRVFSHESVLRIQWPKYWSFGISSGLISFRMYWFDLLAVQRRTTDEKHQFFCCSVFFMVQLSHPYMIIGMKEWQYCYSLFILGGKQESHELSCLEKAFSPSPPSCLFCRCGNQGPPGCQRHTQGQKGRARMIFIFISQISDQGPFLYCR